MDDNNHGEYSETSNSNPHNINPNNTDIVTSNEITEGHDKIDTHHSSEKFVNLNKFSKPVTIYESQFQMHHPPNTALRDEQTEDRANINHMPQPFLISSNLSNLVSLRSFNVMLQNDPQPLLLLALAKLHERSLAMADVNQFDLNNPSNQINEGNISQNDSNLSAPNSLTSAPPSYSFVLRQMSRRRPRLMGTFIPSPSFVQRTPPPNYATAFDIYIDNPIPPPPRVYHFGYMPMLIVCPECGYIGMTIVTSKITASTHVCALVLCLLCCWICAPLPYLLRSCKQVYHYCRNCRIFVGMYCPTNPENTNSSNRQTRTI